MPGISRRESRVEPAELNVAGRLLEWLVAALGLAAAAPVIAASALAVAIEDGFPVFFRHPRVGRRGRTFSLLKIRSMRTGGAGAQITAAGDARVTRTGRFLRRYKLDELPQLWNVLKGEMALIGPRPEAPPFVDAGDPAWRTVLRVRPGITDAASLVYRNEEETLAAALDADQLYRTVILPDKLRLNVEYLATRSLRSDLNLLLLTVRYSFWPAGFAPDRIRKALSLDA